MLKNLFLVVMCHLIGDYVLQIDYIAKTKGENWYHLFVHCALYVLPFYLCFGFVWQLLPLFIMHCIVDTAKAKYKKISYTEDQIHHYIWLLPFIFID